MQLANTLLLGGDYARAPTQYERLLAEVRPERAADDADALRSLLADLGPGDPRVAGLRAVLARLTG